jgi:hypothetical protein
MFAECSTIKNIPKHQQPVYNLLIDAGSTGSRIYIYKVNPTKNTLANIELIATQSLRPGISEFEDDPNKGKKNLTELIKKAKGIIPREDWERASLSLFSTAGMRILDSDKRKRVEKKVMEVLKAESPFEVEKVMTISGKYEGLYAWLGLNYLLDKFNPENEKVGIIEMGGASAQIAYTPDQAFDDFKMKRTINGETYDIYSRSFLRFGIQQVEKLVRAPACYPIGYDIGNGDLGTGDCESCENEIKAKFLAQCKTDPIFCAYENLNLPADNDNFVGLSSFFYTLGTVGLKENIRSNQIQEKANVLCRTEYKALKVKYPRSSKYVHNYCLALNYYQNLFEIFDFHDNQVDIKNKINEIDINWTLGAVIDMELGHLPEAFIENTLKSKN